MNNAPDHNLELVDTTASFEHDQAAVETASLFVVASEVALDAWTERENGKKTSFFVPIVSCHPIFLVACTRLDK